MYMHVHGKELVVSILIMLATVTGKGSLDYMYVPSTDCDWYMYVPSTLVQKVIAPLWCPMAKYWPSLVQEQLQQREATFSLETDFLLSGLHNPVDINIVNRP